MAEAPGPTGNGVVVHLDEEDAGKHREVLRNISNLLDALGRDVAVELVTHGPGLAAVVAGGPVEDVLRGLLDRGVRVDACANTMKARQITKDQLVPGVTVVPAGIAQLVIRQREGWAYVRP